nr:uncharacterized protein LOC106679242 [Halyomorpha halys]
MDRPNSKQWKHEEQMRFLLPHIKTKVPITHYNEESLDLSKEKRGSSPSPEEFPSENEVNVIKTEENSKGDIELPVESDMEESPSRRQANNPKRRRRDSFDSLMAAGVHFMDNSGHLSEQVHHWLRGWRSCQRTGGGAGVSDSKSGLVRCLRESKNLICLRPMNSGTVGSSSDAERQDL